MTSHLDLIGLTEIAARTGYSYSYLARPDNRKRLTRKYGFPRPVMGKKWRRADIDRFLLGDNQPAAAANDPAVRTSTTIQAGTTQILKHLSSVP